MKLLTGKQKIQKMEREMGNSINQIIGTLADTLYVDPTCDVKIDEYYAKRLPKSKRLGSVKELIAYKEFFEFVSCLFADGVEFMTRDQIYAAIKKDWQDVVMHKTDSDKALGSRAVIIEKAVREKYGVNPED